MCGLAPISEPNGEFIRSVDPALTIWRATSRRNGPTAPRPADRGIDQERSSVNTKLLWSSSPLKR